MNNPCFDSERRIDCPDRHAGCAINCEKWAAYAKARDEEYKKRQEECRVKSAIFSMIREQQIKDQKAYIQDRRRHRRCGRQG